MTYIQRSSGVSPFDIAKISGNNSSGTTNVFDTVTKPWASFNSSSKAIETSSTVYSEAMHSPASNTYGLARTGVSGASPHLQGQIIPESSVSGAGGVSRGDDVAIHFGTSHLSVYLWSVAFNVAADTTTSHMKLIRM